MRKFVAFLPTGIPVGMGETAKGVGDTIHCDDLNGLFSADFEIMSSKDTTINGDKVALMIVLPRREAVCR